MENKLYVGNLPYAAGEEDIKTHFSQAGTVTSVALIIDRASGRAKAITVNVARPREERPRNSGDRNRGGGGGRRDRY
jgi:cold-inducible RNA-binding protein